MGHILSIVYRVIATHLTRKAGLIRRTGQTGAVTLIQRFGSALNLNIHFHNQGHDRYVALDLGAAVVPIPAAAWRFAGALGALGIVERRQKSA